jgi:hypothetical protein
MGSEANRRIMAHDPFPYVVKLRGSADDDNRAVDHEVHTIAYDAMEACMQAIFETVGILGEDHKLKIVSVRPDVVAYFALKMQAK